MPARGQFRKKYFCDCKTVCGGALKEVSRAAFRWHERYRTAEGSAIPVHPSIQRLRQEAGISPSASGSNSRSHTRANTTPGVPSEDSQSQPLRSTSPFEPSSQSTTQDCPNDHQLEARSLSVYCHLLSRRALLIFLSISQPSHSPGRPTTRAQADNTETSSNTGDNAASDPSNLNGGDTVLLEEIYSNIKMDDLRIAMEFISALQKASLDDKGVSLDEHAVQRLRTLRPSPSLSPARKPSVRRSSFISDFRMRIGTTRQLARLSWSSATSQASLPFSRSKTRS